MNTKELKIEIPQGYEVDTEKSTFEKIVFKKIKVELPKTWEEFCDQNPIKGEYFINKCSSIIDMWEFCSGNRNYITDKNLLSTKEDAEAHLALMQLHRLRDAYRQGWVPDWNDKYQNKWTIVYKKNKLTIDYWNSVQFFLSFQSQEIAEEFLKNFRDLIEKAKNLI